MISLISKFNYDLYYHSKQLKEQMIFHQILKLIRINILLSKRIMSKFVYEKNGKSCYLSQNINSKLVSFVAIILFDHNNKNKLIANINIP
jgi:hypothetical protein